VPVPKRLLALDPGAHHERYWHVPVSVRLASGNVAMRTRAVVTKQSGRASKWPTAIASLLLIALLPSSAATNLPAGGQADDCCNIGRSDSALRSYAPYDRRRVGDVDPTSGRTRGPRSAVFKKRHHVGRAGVAKTRRAVRQPVRRHIQKKLPPTEPASATQLAPAPPPLIKNWQIATTPVSPVATPFPPPAPPPYSDLDALLTLPSPPIGNLSLRR
jgi:hypothetical protein